MDSDLYSETSSSSDDSSDSAEENESTDNNNNFGKRIAFQLPECFCVEEEVFRETLSPAVWASVLNSKHGERLRSFLPTFPEEDEKEKNITILKLLSGENFKFGTPLKQFFTKLKDGFLSSDIIEIRKALKEASFNEYKNQHKLHTAALLKDVFMSRKKLLDATYAAPPGIPVKTQQHSSKSKHSVLMDKTRMRYFFTLQDLREETGEMDTSSEDENYPEFPLTKAIKKYKKQTLDIKSNTELMKISSSTSFPPGHTGSNMFLNLSLDMAEMSEERLREIMQNYKVKLLTEPSRPELVIAGIDMKGVTSRCNLPKRPSNKNAESSTKKKIKLEKSDSYDTVDNHSPLHFANLIIKEEPRSNSSMDGISERTTPSVQEMEVQTDPLTIIDDADDSQFFDSLQPLMLQSPPRDVHQYSPCFFALLRDIFCELPEHKISAPKLEEKVKTWQSGPTASLFEWVNLQESWSEHVMSALKFLSGDFIKPTSYDFKISLQDILPETFVPFLDYKEKQQQWQWIGSGRDSDDQMSGLCQMWLDSKNNANSDHLDDFQGSPPPPRVPTDWTVRPTLDEEKDIYRLQEAVRYQNPHKAFTFRIHGYEAVVGPVKGVYGKDSSLNKAREHSLLTSDRPAFVTILSLVRDSAARLPNGEGTRSDICELLKDSQYLAPANDQQIHTVVSGALDRLHYEKDPCVKYDVNRKLWIYLHRHRTEEEFERIHQAQAAVAKARKAVQKNKIPRFKNKEVNKIITSALSSSNENPILKVDIPSVAQVVQNTQSPRGGLSPKATLNPKISTAVNRYTIHSHTTLNPNEPKVSKPVTENLTTIGEIKSEPVNTTTSQPIIENLKLVAPTTHIKDILGVCQQAKATTSTISIIKPEPHSDLKPITSQFVGQPPVLQSILTPQDIEKILSSVAITTTKPKTKTFQVKTGQAKSAKSHAKTSQVVMPSQPKVTITSNAKAIHSGVSITKVSNLTAQVKGTQINLPTQSKVAHTIQTKTVLPTLPVKTSITVIPTQAKANISGLQTQTKLTQAKVSMLPGQGKAILSTQPKVTHIKGTHTGMPAQVKSHTLQIQTKNLPAQIKVTHAALPIQTKTVHPGLAKAHAGPSGLASIQTATIPGYQTIVIKQDSRGCNGVSTIPLLSIDDRANPGAPVMARLVGPQYLSFGNLVATTPGVTGKPIMQNFRVQGSNLCQQVSTIKVINSSPVAAMTDTRVPVITLKNQMGTIKDQTVISPSPTTSLNVCGRLFQVSGIPTTTVTKQTEPVPSTETVTTVSVVESADSSTKELTVPTISVGTGSYTIPIAIPNRNIQAVIKSTPK